MKRNHFIFFASFIILAQGCSSVEPKYQMTADPSILDGAWLVDSCTCDGKVTASPEVQQAGVLFVNGDLLFQDQMVRWKKPEWNRYCFVHQVSKITKVDENTFNVSRESKKVYSPRETPCDLQPENPVRTWKIISVNQTELKYESTTGCENGPIICSYKRLDH
jgi:hypothetical protein